MRRYLSLILVAASLVTGCEAEVQPIVAAVTPAEVTLAPGETQVFSASTTSGRETDFSWRASEGSFSSTVGETVIYTAPEKEGEYTVRARPTEGGNDSVEGEARVTVSFTEDLVPVKANTNANQPVTTDLSLEAGDVIIFDVDVSFQTAAAGQALYVELDQNLALSAYYADNTVYATSSSPAFFALGNAGLAGMTQPGTGVQLVPSARRCRGSCITESVLDATYRYRVKNTGESQASINLYAYVVDYSDVGEPENDITETAPALTNFEAGAIESIGDTDFFRVTKDGELFFTPDPDATVDLRAELTDASGEKLDVPAGQGVEVKTGDFVEVFVAGNERAASAAFSKYALKIDDP